MNDKDLNSASQSTGADCRRRRTLFGISAAALAAVGALLAHRHAHAGPMGFGPRHGHGGWYGGIGDMDPAVAAKRIDAMVAFRLAEIDATPEQRERIAAIIKGATNDLQASRKLHMQARRQSLALLAAPTIDRAQLEKLRVEQMQLGDTVSRRMLQAMTECAEVLTPEQRAKLAERWQRHGPPKS